MSNYNSQEMADFWINMIRNKKDPFRTYVTDPALFKQIETINSGSKVLDLGCGEGYVSRHLAQEGHKVTGIDLNPYFIEAAIGAIYGDEKYQEGDALNLSFVPNSFDAAVSNFMLVELEDPSIAIAQVSRVLKPGGRFIFQITHPFSYTSNEGRNNGKIVENYFTSQRILEPFVVDGETSPESAARYHHPLSTYTRSLQESGLLIEHLIEPTPIEETPVDHEIRTILKDPWFVLFNAIKK